MAKIQNATRSRKEPRWPPDKKIVEVYTGKELVHGYRANGRWFSEDGEPISMRGWAFDPFLCAVGIGRKRKCKF